MRSARSAVSHHRRVPLGRIVRVGHGAGAGVALRLPLVRAGRALRQLPLVAEQVLEVADVPLRRRRRPGAFEAAGDGVRADAALEAAPPAEAQLLDVGAFGLRADDGRVAGAVGLAEGVAAGDQRHGLLVVHRHAGEGLADVARRGERIGIAVRAFRIDVDQAHLHGAERIGELALAAVALVAEPLALRAPVDAPRGSQTSSRPPPKPKVLKPIDSSATLPARIIRSAHDSLRPYFCLIGHSRRRALSRLPLSGQLLSGAKRCSPLPRAAAAVDDAVGAGAVPGHADEERTVVAVVGRPPVLRIGHQRVQVLDHGVEVEGLELLGVVERRAHRIGRGRVLVQDC